MPTTIMPTTVPDAANASAGTASQPAWFELPLVNARTGQTFTLADFSGQTILVRAMAEWCTNCRAGQGVWRDQVLTQVDSSRVVVVSLDVETNNSAESLATYADNNEFPWIFAVMSPDMLTALVQQFGNTVATPPAEPQFLIRPDGSVVGLLTDHSAETLISLINDASA
jgi:cytochrome oxidase Cu insertion factor (SCO1/SenC/PrrC family)